MGIEIGVGIQFLLVANGKSRMAARASHQDAGLNALNLVSALTDQTIKTRLELQLQGRSSYSAGDTDKNIWLAWSRQIYRRRTAPKVSPWDDPGNAKNFFESLRLETSKAHTTAKCDLMVTLRMYECSGGYVMSFGSFIGVLELFLTAPGRIDASEFLMPVTLMCYRVQAKPVIRSSAS